MLGRFPSQYPDLRSGNSDIRQDSVVEARQFVPGYPLPSPSLNRLDGTCDRLETRQERCRQGLAKLQVGCNESVERDVGGSTTGVGGLSIVVLIFHLSISNV